MTYNENDFIRVVGSLALTQPEKDKMSEFLIKNMGTKKELSGKHIAVVSCAAVVAVGVYYALKGHKQDKFNVR